MITRRHLLFGGGVGLLALTGCGPQQAVDLVLGVEAPVTAVNPATALDLPAHLLRRLTVGEHPDDRAALLALAKTPDAAVEAWASYTCRFSASFGREMPDVIRSW